MHSPFHRTLPACGSDPAPRQRPHPAGEWRRQKEVGSEAEELGREPVGSERLLTAGA